MRDWLLARGYVRRLAALAMFTAALAYSAQPLTLVTNTKHFEFHSDVWINLHHLLYQWAREDLGLIRGRPPMPERSDVARMSSVEREGWMKAVRFYRETLGPRWHLDRDNLRINQDLLYLRGDGAASPRETIKGLAATLASTMPVYKRLWWPQHNRANRSWIAKLVPNLRRHETRFVELTARVYEATWPTSPFRVDVSVYFNSRAGYTSFEGHLVLYSTDPASQDLYALEMLLHEVQHAQGISDQAISQTALAATFEGVGKKQPENLWHFLIFASAGEFVRSVAVREGLPEHIPYWIKQGFPQQDGWRDLISPVQKHWLPALRGETSRAEAIGALAGAFE